MELCEYTADELATLVPFPDDGANKYSRGKLVAVAGSARYPGAACLAARASQRMGAGYTEVVTDETAVGLVRACSASLVVRSAENWRASDVASSAPGKPLAYLVGSGFDAVCDESSRLVRLVLKRAQAPVIIDGGGLSLLATAKSRALLKRRFVRAYPTVVTPHAGEAARLAAPFALPTDDPAALSRSLSLAYGVTTLVKGPVSYISDGERIVRMAEGTPALAKAGTGDVLAGMVGALLAQGLEVVDACVLAATLHARAGRAAAERLTTVCVTAEDVIEALPAAIASLASSV